MNSQFHEYKRGYLWGKIWQSYVFLIHELLLYTWFKLVNQQALYKQVSSMIFKTDVICKLFQVHVPFMVLIDINVSLNWC